MQQDEVYRQAWTGILRRLGASPAAKWFQAKLDPSALPLYAQRIAPSHPTSLDEAEVWLNRIGSDKLSALAEIRRPMVNALRYNVGPSVAAIRVDALKLLRRLDDETEKHGALCAALVSVGRPFVAARKAFPEAASCADALERFAREPGLLPGAVALVADFWFPFASYFAPGDPNVAKYDAQIASPLCLADVNAHLANAEYASLDAFRAAVVLVFENARAFWGHAHAIAATAASLAARFTTILEETLAPPIAVPSRAPRPAAPVAPRPAAPVVLAVPQQPVVVASSVPSSAVETATAPPVSRPQADSRVHGASLVQAVAAPVPPARRTSGASAVAATHHRGVGGQMSREEARRCLDLLAKLELASTTSPITGTTVRLAGAFLYPVASILADFPEYGSIVANPIDLHIIKAKLQREPPDYSSVAELSADILLMVSNCKAFNTDPGSRDVVVLADKLWDRFRSLFNDAFVGLATVAQQPSRYPPGATSHGESRREPTTTGNVGSQRSKDVGPAPPSRLQLKPASASGGDGGSKIVLKLQSAHTDFAVPVAAVPASFAPQPQEARARTASDVPLDSW